MKLGERILVRRLRKGDREACRELIRRHHEGVYGYLRRLGADPALAEDLAQETYAKAWLRIAALREAASLRCWLLTIARNEFFQWVRSRPPEAARPGTRALAADADAAEIPAAEIDPERAILVDERDRIVRRAVGMLEDDLRETIALHYFQDLSLREVGAVLGIPAGTAKSRVHRALERLRALLEPMEADHEEERAGAATAGLS